MSTDRRDINTGPSPISDQNSPPPFGTSNQASSSASVSQNTSSWKKRVSTACLACKKSKRKCSGTPPCTNCITFHRTCIFDESLDQRRRVAAKRTADELSHHRDLLNDIFTLVREADSKAGLRLLDIIRDRASAEEIRGYIDETLSSLSGRLKTGKVVRESHHHESDVDVEAASAISARVSTSTGTGTGTGTGSMSDTSASTTEKENVQSAISKLEDLKEITSIHEGVEPSFRSKVMDLNYLCDEAPIKVPAKPWTNVTDDNDLVSHLVSLYFTWDYPVHAFLDRDVFLKYMCDPGNSGEGEFCSAFLVNALLSNACYFSEFSEAYVIPGDISSKGCNFLAEAERLKADGPTRPSLATLQGTLLMYERYAMSRDDDLGYVMLHEAIRMGESLGLVGNSGPRITSEQLSKDMDCSCRRTAWGLFNIDTMVHTGFLRPCLISYVNMPRVDRDSAQDQLIWQPYPSHRGSRPSEISLYFDEACNLSTIARDISRSTFGGEWSPGSSRETLYDQLLRWRALLPSEFEGDMPPHLILLLMRQHTLTINLFSCISDDVSKAPKTPESPRNSPEIKYNPWNVVQIAARSIAALARLHRREYGMSRAHPFALYAINLALFTMMEPTSFDILDQDFLSLASALSIVASRSALGRNLFHIFRQSARAKAQGDRIRNATSIPDELKDLFDVEPNNQGHSRFDEYAEGLEKLNRDEKYHGIGENNNLQNYPGLGLSDMLDRYESLSLGKDSMLTERHRPAPC